MIFDQHLALAQMINRRPAPAAVDPVVSIMQSIQPGSREARMLQNRVAQGRNIAERRAIVLAFGALRESGQLYQDSRARTSAVRTQASLGVVQAAATAVGTGSGIQSRLRPAISPDGSGVCAVAASAWKRMCATPSKKRCAIAAAAFPSVWSSTGTFETRDEDFTMLTTFGQLNWNQKYLEGVYPKVVTSVVGTTSGTTTTITVPGSWPVGIGIDLNWYVGFNNTSPIAVTIETTKFVSPIPTMDDAGAVVYTDVNRKDIVGNLPPLLNGGDLYLPFAARATRAQDLASVKLGMVVPGEDPTATIVIKGAPNTVTWTARPLGAFNTEALKLLADIESYLAGN
jgi:hypothetical protein